MTLHGFRAMACTMDEVPGFPAGFIEHQLAPFSGSVGSGMMARVIRGGGRLVAASNPGPLCPYLGGHCGRGARPRPGPVSCGSGRSG